MIEAVELSKTYRVRQTPPGMLGAVRALWSAETVEVHAVERLNFHLAAGSSTALLGRNGAGKSTVVKLLAGVLSPSSGWCRVAGLHPREDRRAHTRNIGVVFGQRSQLWWDLPVRDTFRILSRIYDVPVEQAMKDMATYDQMLALGEILDQPVRTLSLGQRMRAEIAAALFHRPRVLVLDEPTVGLDLLVKDAVHELINHIVADRGTTLVLTSHDVGDISALCDQALVIDEGSLSFTGLLSDLLTLAPDRRLELAYSGNRNTAAAVATLQERLGPAARCRQLESRRIEVVMAAEAFRVQDVLSAADGILRVTDILVPEPTLADVLKEIFRHSSATPVTGGADGFVSDDDRIPAARPGADPP